MVCNSGSSEYSDEEKWILQTLMDARDFTKDLLRQNRVMLKAIASTVAREQGYELQYDDAGHITGYTPDPDAVSQGQLKSKDLDELLEALRGELPISPVRTFH